MTEKTLQRIEADLLFKGLTDNRLDIPIRDTTNIRLKFLARLMNKPVSDVVRIVVRREFKYYMEKLLERRAIRRSVGRGE